MIRDLIDLLTTMPDHPTRTQRVVVGLLLVAGMLLLAMVPER